jgi:hypothetical protein
MSKSEKSCVMRRRVLIALAVSLAGVSFQPRPVTAQGPAPVVEVWKSPTCGCCNDWIRHLEANGFRVKAYDKGNTGVRAEFGMPSKYGSCHTARVDGYIVEGHVPAREIKRLLREKPAALGLSVPEMPIGSPGMDGPEYGGQVDPYDVLLVQRNGSASVFATYRSSKGRLK